MKYLADSDWIVDSLRGRRAATGTLLKLSPEGLAISIISVAELYEGAYHFPEPEQHLITLRAFLKAFTVLTISDSIADRFARIRAQLRSKGKAPADLDILIGATALEYDLTLLTRNVRHFNRIEGLRIYSA